MWRWVQKECHSEASEILSLRNRREPSSPPALSPEERAQQSTALANPNGLRFADRLAKIPPLPKGEGWGEGEENAQLGKRLRQRASPPLLHPLT